MPFVGSGVGPQAIRIVNSTSSMAIWSVRIRPPLCSSREKGFGNTVTDAGIDLLQRRCSHVVRLGIRPTVIHAAPDPVYGNVAGDENGLVASTTNITSACRSAEPLLETCIGVSAPWPVSD